MATGWFLVPYDYKNEAGFVYRAPGMDRFTSLIRADGGSWSEAECLGDEAVTKVSAFPATLNLIANEPEFIRIPMNLLDNTLAELTPQQRTAIRNKLEALGYPTQEIIDRLGNNLANVTLRQILRFILTRRKKPRWDGPSQSIILDGPNQTCKTIEQLDGEV